MTTEVCRVDLQITNLGAGTTADDLRSFLSSKGSVKEIINAEVSSPGRGWPRAGTVRVRANPVDLETDLRGANIDGKHVEYSILGAAEVTDAQLKEKLSFNHIVTRFKQFYSELNSEDMLSVYNKAASMIKSSGEVNIAAQNLQGIAQTMAPLFAKLRMPSGSK